MSNLILKSPQLSFTPIDNTFIDRYLFDTRGDFVKVYIYCLRLGYASEDITIDKIAQALGLLQTDIMKAFEYWEDKGLMRLTTDGTIEILPFDYSSHDNSINFDKTVKEMFESLEQLLGRPLSSKEVHTYMGWIEDFSFTPEIITLLVEYCCARKKTDIRYIEKVAISWHDSGIRSVEDAQSHITKHEDKWNKYRAILTFMGMKDADISKPQEEFLEKWLIKYNYSVDVITEACRICIMRINECSFSYIDAIIGDWYKNGVKNLSDVKKVDKKKPGKKHPQAMPGNYSNQRRYDVKELENQLLGRGEVNEQ